MRQLLVILSIIMMLFSFWGCQKKEEEAAAKKSPVPQGPIIDRQAEAPAHGAPARKTEFQVVVPPEVQEQWAQVVIIVDDKKENTKKEYTVNIDGELNIPDSNLTLKVGPFLPDFKMSGTVITSSSNETNNPSVGVAVFEEGRKLFPSSGEWGWLYAKFPTIHSFQHERFSLTLKEGIKK